MSTTASTVVRTRPKKPAGDAAQAVSEPLVTVKVPVGTRDRMNKVITLERAEALRAGKDAPQQSIGRITAGLMDEWSKRRLRHLQPAA